MDENNPITDTGFERYASITHTRTLADSSPLTVEYEITQPQITADQTAALEATVTNESDGEIKCQTPIYKNRNENYDERSLFLFSPEAPDTPASDYSPNCLTDPNGRNGLTSTWEGWPLYNLRSGESFTVAVLLVDDLRTDACFAPGEYRYEPQLMIFDSDDKSHTELELYSSVTIKITESKR